VAALTPAVKKYFFLDMHVVLDADHDVQDCGPRGRKATPSLGMVAPVRPVGRRKQRSFTIGVVVPAVTRLFCFLYFRK
jgi:hypothetical protein